MANDSHTHWSHPLTVKLELGVAVLETFEKVAIAYVLGLSQRQKSGCFVSRKQPIACRHSVEKMDTTFHSLDMFIYKII